MALPKDEGVLFNVHVVGDTSGQTWAGEFRAKERLSFSDRISIDRLRRELLGANPAGADGEAFSAATMIAELSVRITKAPEFWKESRGGLDLVDNNLLMDVFDQACKVEKAALARLTDAAEAAKKDLREQKAKEER